MAAGRLKYLVSIMIEDSVSSRSLCTHLLYRTIAAKYCVVVVSVFSTVKILWNCWLFLFLTVLPLVSCKITIRGFSKSN